MILVNSEIPYFAKIEFLKKGGQSVCGGGSLYSFSFCFRKLAKRGGGGYPQALPEVVTLSQSFLDHKVLQKDVCKKSMHSPQVS